MRKKRHNYTPEEKVSILRRHLVEHVAVSDLCDEFQLQPKIFYIWQKQFFENGAAAFTRAGNINGIFADLSFFLHISTDSQADHR